VKILLRKNSIKSWILIGFFCIFLKKNKKGMSGLRNRGGSVVASSDGAAEEGGGGPELAAISQKSRDDVTLCVISRDDVTLCVMSRDDVTLCVMMCDDVTLMSLLAAISQQSSV
jgi:hypothetical protein